MALDFPANPTNGQTFGTYIYDTSIPGWRNVNTSEGIGLQFKSGLVPIIPTSVTVGSGSATVSSDGTISLSAAGYCLANGVFTTTYKNYLIKLNLVHSSGDYLAFRMTNAGSQNSTSNYYTVSTGVSGAGALNSSAQPADSYSRIGYVSTTYANATYDVYVFQPKVADQTTWNVIGGYSNVAYWNRGLFNASNSFDGFMLLPQNTGNYSVGTVRIYGYN